MKHQSKCPRFLALLVVCLIAVLSPALVFASSPTQVTVECSNPKAKISTITAGLAMLPTAGPSVLLVSGTCNESVEIDGFNFLTIQGNPTATINGGTDPNFNGVDILRSNVNLNNLTISSPVGAGVLCDWLSSCKMDHVTIQNALECGLFVGRESFAKLNLVTVQNNGSDASSGVFVGESTLVVDGSTIQGNGSPDAGDGISVGDHGTLIVRQDDAGTVPSVIQNNLYGNGISAHQLAAVTLEGSIPTSVVISGNGGDGVALGQGSTATFRRTTITNNGNHGVRIGDLSMANFRFGNSISGNPGTQVDCDPQFSTTRGIGRLSLPQGQTNCPAEVPPNP